MQAPRQKLLSTGRRAARRALYLVAASLFAVRYLTDASLFRCSQILMGRSLNSLIRNIRSRVRLLLQADKPVARHDSCVAGSRIQLYGNTSEDRYPEIFAKAVELATRDVDLSKPLRVLSFGCSTGQEAYSLEERYFSTDRDVKIIGLDINPDAVELAREHNRAPGRIEFFVSSDRELARHGPYDLIFAMSVLCVWPETAAVDDISPFMTFEQFEKHLKNLDAHLRPGGHLVIYNASFCFSDSRVAVNYEPILIEGQSDSGFVRKFDARNRSRGEDFTYPYVIFRKLR